MSRPLTGMAAASAELQTKITELQTQIDALDAKIGASTTDDDTTAECRPTFARSTNWLFSANASINCKSMRRCRPATPS